jgi:hypothetical protein
MIIVVQVFQFHILMNHILEMFYLNVVLMKKWNSKDKEKGFNDE